MALVRVAQYSSTPTVVGDYQAQNAHLQAFINQLMTQQFILDSGTDQPVIKQGCYVSHGGSLYIADADTPITGSPSDGSVYIRVSGTTSLTVEFVNDISGYAWNPVYTALTSGSYTLLPYLIVKASAVWTRYNFNPNNQSFGTATMQHGYLRCPLLAGGTSLFTQTYSSTSETYESKYATHIRGFTGSIRLYGNLYDNYASGTALLQIYLNSILIFSTSQYGTEHKAYTLDCSLTENAFLELRLARTGAGTAYCDFNIGVNSLPSDMLSLLALEYSFVR